MKRLLFMLFLLVISSSLVFYGCQEASESDSNAIMMESPQKRLSIMIALVQSHHARADIAVGVDDSASAEGAMDELIGVLSKLNIDNPERVTFLLDAYARLARLRSQRGDLEGALETVQRGLELYRKHPRANLFAGYLFQIQGDLFLEGGQDLEAARAHKEAILVFTELLKEE